jgi:hypothetical protein
MGFVIHFNSSNIVRNHSIKTNGKIYLVPGFENTLFGLSNLNPLELNCCLHYEVREENGSYIVYVKYNFEDYYEFEHRYSFNSTLPYTNEDLFYNYGFSIEENPQDYLNYTIFDKQIKLSCNEFDLNNVKTY